jgi:hypothetical protein
MSVDLSVYDGPEHQRCLTTREVSEHADFWLLTNLASNRELAAHLLRTAGDLMVTAQTVMRLYLEDGYDHAHRTTGDGFTDAQRHQVLTLASTCIYNANLFVQEAQRRRIKRRHPGWDPITLPVFT